MDCRTRKATAPSAGHTEGGEATNTAGAVFCQPHYTTAQSAAQDLQHGHVVGDVWRKQASSTRHMLTRPPAWALDCADLNAARARGALFCEIEDLDTGRVYRASFRAIDAHGFRFDRGHGQQVALALACWQCFSPQDVAREQRRDTQRIAAILREVRR